MSDVNFSSPRGIEIEIDTEIEAVQRAAWHFLWTTANPQNGLVPDHIEGDGAVISPSSIAVTGMALSSLPVAVERGWISRAEAARRALATLRFFDDEAEQCGGFFFHFLDLQSGKRAWKCEVSSIDSTILFLGALFCGAYFSGKNGVESEIRARSEAVFARADWSWFCNGSDAVSIAYRPEKGFSKHHWRGYNEALLLAVLTLGAPQPLPPQSYDGWTKTYRFKRVFGQEILVCRPLFTHLFPHMWLDLRGQSDAILRDRDLDYWQTTQRAIESQIEWARRSKGRQNAISDVLGDARAWGVSASDGPPELGGYRGRGAPWGHFDGAYSPPVCLASLSFTPDAAQEAWRFWLQKCPDLVGEWGVRSAFVPQTGWLGHFAGLDQGMLVMMLENARSGLLWELSRQVPALQKGLTGAGFRSFKKVGSG